MKSKKVILSELKVKSFITNIDKEISRTAKGGASGDGLCYSDICNTLANCVTKAIQGCGTHNQEK